MVNFWLLSPVPNLVRSSIGYSIVDKTRILQGYTQDLGGSGLDSQEKLQDTEARL